MTAVKRSKKHSNRRRHLGSFAPGTRLRAWDDARTALHEARDALYTGDCRQADHALRDAADNLAKLAKRGRSAPDLDARVAELRAQFDVDCRTGRKARPPGWLRRLFRP